MSIRPRWVANLAALALTLGVLALGGLWLADRGRRWETPWWRHTSFVPLGAAAASDGRRVRWVMPVNPRCEHCMATLARLHAAWSERGWRPGLVALVVDAPERPDSASLGPIPTAQIWWDARGVWRRRWGHRLYGELIQFDDDGRFVRTVLAEDIIRNGRLPLVDETPTPATPIPGGG